ncbi:MAG TPA: outer membrane protein assembly factor BamA [Chitinophagales bacterium]|nr:outer membrane protein assembly factor BamA [Chitinophagales bacterium]
MNKIFFLLVCVLVSTKAFAQVTIDYANPREYTLGGVTVNGTKFLDKDILVLLSGLKVGERVLVPGNDLTKSVQSLWKQGLFDDVNLKAIRAANDTVWLEINVVEKPRLSTYSFKGIRKGQQEDLRKKLNLIKGKVLTEGLMVTTENTVKDFYVEKGYREAKVTLETKVDTTSGPNHSQLIITVDKGKRVKIDEIEFTGNTAVSDNRLYRLMKKTKRNTWWSVMNVSKFNEKEYRSDKASIIEFYNKKGHRDAVIQHDTMWYNADGNLEMRIAISEGNKYYFRDITWKGNAKHSTGKLDSLLAIQKGDVYNTALLQRRLFADPNQNDVSSLYLDDGYLFFSATPVESAVDGDSIDLEIRIYEGPQATINEVNIAGNEKTNERVIRRAIRTLPGNKFSRADIIRSQRELATLGFFNPEKIEIVPVPHPENGTVDINYRVEEKPSDQLELSAGYGGRDYGVTGALGVKFTNFSTSNIFRKEGWQPIPSGDGQQLAIRAQSNSRFYQTYNVSFTEPWLGGKKPNSLSVGIYHSKITTGVSRENDAYGYLITNGASVGIGKQLRWPDDYFSFLSSVDYQNYNLNNYNSRSFIITDGTSNALSFKQTLSRNSLSDFTFPRYGSNVTLSVQLTPPWSLLNGKDYTTLTVNEKYKWIEYHKYRFNVDWYTPIVGKLVLRTSAKTGFMGFYNPEVGFSPFERFELGGDGLSNYSIYGKDIISQRGYDPVPGTYVPEGGATIFNKFTAELRYPFSTNPNAFIYGLVFAEGGNQWLNFKDYNPFDLNRSVGVGMRFLLPAFGLLGFDYGIPFDSHRVDPRLGKPTNLKGLLENAKFSIVLGFEPE